MMTEPATYLRPYGSFDAIQFDGSPESAVAIATAFPKLIARAVEPGDRLLALCFDSIGYHALHVVAPGCWLVKAGLFGRLELLADEHFRAVYVPQPQSA